jgi:nicotinamidase-related amidase
VLDELSAALMVTILKDAIAAVDPDGTARAIVQMREPSAQVVTRADLFVGRR